MRRFFHQTWVELAVGALVMVSVALTLVEFAMDAADSGAVHRAGFQQLVRINDAITYLFVVELTLRFLAARSKLRYFREFWLDILAVLPVFRVFRAGRALRLLRLVRILRVVGVTRRLSSRFPHVLRRGMVEYLFACGLLLVTVVFGTGAMLYFEGRLTHGASPDATDGEEEAFHVEHAFWFSIYSLFAGEPIPGPPRTPGGKLVAVAIMFMGVTVFAMFTGTVSAFMIERLHQEGNTVEWESLHDHLIICGWSSRAELIIDECRRTALRRGIDIVVIAQHDQEPDLIPQALRNRALYLDDDFTRVAALEKAGIHRARTCIILADTRGGRTERDADARTILGALTVEKLNHQVYTCAEVFNRDYGSHLSLGKIDNWIVAGEHGAYLLAHAAMKGGLVEVCTELLTSQRGNEFYRLKTPASWQSKTFLEALVLLKQEYDAILVAVHPSGGAAVVNPDDAYLFKPGDEIVVIAREDFSLT